MEIFFTILIMTLVVSLSGVVTRVMPFQIPLPLMQIAIGALLAWPTFGLHVEFDPELFLVLFIPPLLFADGWKTPTREFLEHGREIFGLALALVVVTVVGIGFLIYWVVPGIPLIPAFALAAVLSPTDAVALSGIVGEGRIPKKIMGILQGEALMNDASGLVSLKFAVAVAMGTMIFTVGGATVEFMKVAIGGILAGFVVSWLYGRSLRFLSRWGGDEPATQIVLLFLLPFASYLIAEHIGVSGILAAVAAGMTITRSGVMRRAPLAMRLRANRSRDFRPRAGAGGGHRGRHWLPYLLGGAGHSADSRLCAGGGAFSDRCCGAFRYCWRRAHPEKNHGYFAGRSVDE